MLGKNISFYLPPLLPSAAMVAVVALSNVWAQEPYRINDYLLWASFTYPFVFAVTDLTTLFYGAVVARRVVACGFVVAGFCSFLLATPRIAMASLTAFALSQMLDISVFVRLRRAAWWKAPLVSSGLASVLDTWLFFALAFFASGIAWPKLALGDLCVKLGFALCFLLPFRLLLRAKRCAKKYKSPAS